MEGEEGLQVRLTGEASVGDVSLGVFTRRDVLPYNAVWSAVCDDDTHLCEKQISAVTKRRGKRHAEKTQVWMRAWEDVQRHDGHYTG